MFGASCSEGSILTRYNQGLWCLEKGIIPGCGCHCYRRDCASCGSAFCGAGHINDPSPGAVCLQVTGVNLAKFWVYGHSLANLHNAQRTHGKQCQSM